VTLAQQDGAGFEVSTAGLHSASGQLRQCSEDVSTAAREFTGHQDTAALGGVADAWDGFSREWARQSAIVQRAVADLAGKVSSTAATYQDAERRSHATVRNALGGQSR
jgi:uncharacterized protein YukE